MDTPTPKPASGLSPDPWSRPYTFDRVVRIIISLAVLAGAVWLIDILSGVLLPFLVAWLAAYILEPFVQYNKRLLRVRGRLLPVFMTLFEFALTLIVLCVLFLPSVLAESHRLAQLIAEYSRDGAQVAFIPAGVHDFLRDYIDFNAIASSLTRQDIQSIVSAAGSLLSSGLDLVLGIFSWFIVLLYIVFIMLDYEKLLSGFKRLVPPRARGTVFRIANDVKDSMNHYFRGQALVAFIVGILFAVGFLIVGLPMAVVLGLFIGLLNMVPYLQLISIIPTTLLCLVCSANSEIGFWEIWWECMAVYVIVQCIQDLFLTPKILGKAMGLNPAIILLSLSVWGTLLGFIGLIIALPLTTLLLAYYDQYISHRRDGGSAEERAAASRALEEMTHTLPD